MMTVMLLLLTVGHALAQTPVFAPSEEIDELRPVVGGDPAEIGAWPSAAAVFIGNNFSCSGVLVHERYVLTAAHCGGALDGVIVGANDWTDPDVEFIDVVGVTLHEDFLNSYDVALLELAEAAQTPPSPLGLDCVIDDHLYDGADVSIVGFGATDQGGVQVGTVLYEAIAPVVDHDCADVTRGCMSTIIPNGELIAGGDGVDSCIGDSGGPIYLRAPTGDFLVGTTSRAATPATVSCGDGGIYVRFDAIADWIEQTAGISLTRPDCGSVNRSPQPSARLIHTHIGGTVTTTIDAGDPDPDDTHSFHIVAEPTHGVAELDGQDLLFTADRPGLDRVEIEVTDDGDPPLSSTLSIDIEVELPVPEAAGCGCTSGPPGAGWIALWGALCARRR